jgi:hypothetical protein
MANFTDVGLDLQNVMRRTYANLLYRSTFFNFLNEQYIGDIRQAGTPAIEILKNKKTTVNTRAQAEMLSTDKLDPALAGYDTVLVKLTELAMDYSFRIPVLVVGSNITNAIDEQIRLNDDELVTKIDVYGYNKLATKITGDRTNGNTVYTTGTVVEWAPSTKEDYISLLNNLKAQLFNLKVYDSYRLGLEAVEYGNLVSALTSILKFETMAGVEGVDRGEVARAYGIDIFQIASSVLTNNELGYFAHPIGTVGDTFFTDMVEYNGNYPGYPGYYCVEGNVLFGAEVVRPEAIIKLVSEISG